MSIIERHLTETYSNSFKKFLNHTDEKKILFEEINKRILENKSDSLLDIGAGNGDLAIPLSKTVEKYVAVERKPDYINKLRGVGLTVIDGLFPCEVGEKFDFILASHSFPWKRESYEPFINTAFKLLHAGGVFLGVTYDDENGDWIGMLDACGLEFNKESRLENMEKWLNYFSFFKRDIVTTYVRTESLEDMMGALAFVYSDGSGEKIEKFMGNEKIREYLEEKKYRNKYGYFFPFNHMFLEIRNTLK
jgi:SAM-dependent methyltransferase